MFFISLFNTDIQEADEEQAEKEKEQLKKIEADKKEIKDKADAEALNASVLAYKEEDKLFKDSIEGQKKTGEPMIKSSSVSHHEDNLLFWFSCKP